MNYVAITIIDPIKSPIMPSIENLSPDFIAIIS